MKFKLVEDYNYKPTFQPYTYDELLDGMNGNVSDEDLDNFIKFMNILSRRMKTKPENIIAFRSEDELFEFVSPETEKLKIAKSIVTIYNDPIEDKILCAKEFVNGNYWYYVKDENDFFNCFTDDYDEYEEFMSGDSLDEKLV